MTAITDSRKRSREEDGSDFMPLSKRITNLHINTLSSPMQSDNIDYNMNLNQQQHQQILQQHHQQSLQFQNQNQFIGSFVQSNGQFSEFSNLSHPIDVHHQERQYHQYMSECNKANGSNGSSGTNISPDDNVNRMAAYDPYAPELSQEENPFYYTKNKLLYDLYLERVRRHQ